MHKAPGGLEAQLVDAAKQAARRFVRFESALPAGHPGPDRARMEDHDRYPSCSEVARHRYTGRVERCLAHPIAVVAAGRVVADGSPCGW